MFSLMQGSMNLITNGVVPMLFSILVCKVTFMENKSYRV